jgi:23S rRNA pseudouridine2605 synthase
MGRQRSQPGQRVQLHRAVSKLGWGSRTQAWDWIRAGQVCVDGQVVTEPLTWIDLALQSITLRGPMPSPPRRLTLALHKPCGVVTTRRDERGRRTVYDLLPPDLPWVFPAGRLDADSEGLLILTNDSRLSVHLTEPGHRVPKTYRVTIRGTPTAATLARLRRGIDLADGRTRPAGVKMIGQGKPGETVIEMVLTEGRNRQIRRMCSAVGYRVKRLVRVAVGKLELGGLPAGGWRELSEKEIDRLFVSQ